ncbi:MAG: hypothetical protein EA396_03765 [Anaerolineaceae bacterium]|nr:MAG: hypothetical protein EA396_03765 [Anaerolineaceae bacterium]
MLAIFAAPNVLPSLLAQLVPFVDEGVPCSRLRVSQDRAYHQSLLGRAVSEERGADVAPFSLSVSTSAPSAAGGGSVMVTIVVVNRSIGTVPIIIRPGQLVDPNGTQQGLGVVVGNNPLSPPGEVAPQQANIAPEDVRLLGPRQRCVHRVEVTTNVSQFIDGVAVRAFYRNNSAAQATPRRNYDFAPVFNDQGLWVGLVTSPPFTVPRASALAP